MREREIELADEQSRYLDLISWGIAKQTINAEKQLQIDHKLSRTKIDEVLLEFQDPYSPFRGRINQTV